jgi:hypothetical protein
MFGGNNKSVVDSSMQINAKLHKHHTMLFFHRVREAIAGILSFYFIPGDDNPADIISGNWGYKQIKERLLSLLFCRGDTANIKSVSED